MSERKAPEPAFEIPDLELAPPVSKRAPQPHAPRGNSAPLTPESAAFGLEISLPDLDDEDDEVQLLTGPNVELSVSASPQAVQRNEHWPHGHTRPVEQLPIDPAEVTLTAGYGSPPQNAILAPVYAYRVLARRAPLKRAIAQQHALLARAELERDSQLMLLSHELRPVLEANDAFRRLLEPLRDVERTAGERNAALSVADAGYREQMGRFDADLSLLRETAAQTQALSDQKQSIADGTENELRRAEAKHQRAQIEIRGVLEVARQTLGPAGGDLPPEQAAKLAELQARAAAIEPELAQAKSAHATATVARDQAQAEVRRVQGQARQLERQKSAAGSTLQKQLSVRAQSVTEAEDQQRNALADVARAVLAARGAVKVPEAWLSALRDHDKSVQTSAIRLETHVRALDSYARERVRLGVILLLSAVGVVLLSILLNAML